MRKRILNDWVKVDVEGLVKTLTEMEDRIIALESKIVDLESPKKVVPVSSGVTVEDISIEVAPKKKTKRKVKNASKD